MQLKMPPVQVLGSASLGGSPRPKSSTGNEEIKGAILEIHVGTHFEKRKAAALGAAGDDDAAASDLFVKRDNRPSGER